MVTIKPTMCLIGLKYARTELYDKDAKLFCFLREDGSTTFNECYPQDSTPGALMEVIAQHRAIIADLLEERARLKQRQLARMLESSDGD